MLDHVSKAGMIDAIQMNRFTKGFTAHAQKYCHALMICAMHNRGRQNMQQQAAHPQPDRPFKHLMMDFI